MPKAVVANVTHIPQESAGNPDCEMDERSTDLTDPCQRSCVVLWGHLLASAGSECQPSCSAALVISLAASDFTKTFGLLDHDGPRRNATPLCWSRIISTTAFPVNEVFA